MKEYKYILFDLDGTLTDPAVGITTCVAYALKKLGIEGDYVGVGNLILGYRAGDLPAVRPRKENYIYRV
jgi:phosphoglycolate phosphatase-like HAD superfamily hydrolase